MHNAYTYIWEWPVRITHWINVISMIMLSIDRVLHRPVRS